MRTACVVCGDVPCVCGAEYRNLSDKMLLKLMHSLQCLCVDRALTPQITILGTPLVAMVSAMNGASQLEPIHLTSVDDVLPTSWHKHIQQYKGRSVYSMYVDIANNDYITYRTPFALYILHKIGISNWRLFNVLARLMEAHCGEYIYPNLLRQLVAYSGIGLDSNLTPMLRDIYAFRSIADEAHNTAGLAAVRYITTLVGDLFAHRRPGEVCMFNLKQFLFIVTELLLIGATEELTYRLSKVDDPTVHTYGDYYICELVDCSVLSSILREKELIPLDVLV